MSAPVGAADSAGPSLWGVPAVFVVFGLTLVGVTLFSRRALAFALGGLAGIVALRLWGGGVDWVSLAGKEWAKLINLFGLLVGFALVADHFEKSRLPEQLPRVLPRGWMGAFSLLLLVWALSGVLDNIAAALIGAAAATRVFARLHPGYVAALVAAANAGGAGSVIGDTTTTMMWLEGVRPVAVLPAYIGAATALLVFGGVAAWQQHRSCDFDPTPREPVRVDRARVVVVAASVAALAIINFAGSYLLGEKADSFPLLATILWVVLVVSTRFRAFNWGVARRASHGALFLVTLVVSASLLPVASLPKATLSTTIGLGFVAALFDNIPLTKLALDQGGYDWAVFAYSIGLGGSMIWFGTSAGVAVSEAFPSVRSVAIWLKNGWHIPIAFLTGHAVMYLIHGWRP